MAAKANHSYTEQDAEVSNSGQEEDKGSEAQTMIDPITGIHTPFKDERSLKRSIIEVTNMKVDTTAKNPRVSN